MLLVLWVLVIFLLLFFLIQRFLLSFILRFLFLVLVQNLLIWLRFLKLCYFGLWFVCSMLRLFLRWGLCQLIHFSLLWHIYIWDLLLLIISLLFFYLHLVLLNVTFCILFSDRSVFSVIFVYPIEPTLLILVSFW